MLRSDALFLRYLRTEKWTFPLELLSTQNSEDDNPTQGLNIDSALAFSGAAATSPAATLSENERCRLV
jgi:hypothetical protein